MYHSNKYHAAAACEHCEGIIRHELWCITVNPKVYYAYAIVIDPSKLTEEDAVHLRGMGLVWCNCKIQEEIK